MKEIVKAINETIVQGILDWKMPLFQGFLGALLAMATQVVASLNDYSTWESIDTLSWVKIRWSVTAAVATYLVGFLNTSVARTRNTIEARNAEPSPELPAPTSPSPTP